MDRRDFLKSAGALALTAGLVGKLSAVAEETVNAAPAPGGDLPDLVAVRGDSPAAMFDAGIAALGGIAAFVKPGQTVVVKPNIGWDREPQSGADTNPELVGRIVKHCMDAGAREVAVFDYTCDRDWMSCYTKSGIKAAVEAAGGRMAPGNQEEDYREIDIPGAVRMKKAKVHRLILDSDVFINCPVLKHHGGAKLTCAMKNFMGLVWDRRFMHSSDLQQCIADASLIRRPDLNVVDAWRVMTTGGPRGNANSVMKDLKSQLLSRDIVAIDTAAARLIEFPLDTIGHIPHGETLGLGTTALNSLNIRRIVL